MEIKTVNKVKRKLMKHKKKAKRTFINSFAFNASL